MNALRTYDHADFEIERLVADKASTTVTVCVPTRETAKTIEGTVTSLLELSELGLVDQVVVVDASSEDGTAEVAAAAGAEVHDEGTLMPEFGAVMGKGDAMWRSLSVCRGDLISFVDGDVSDFAGHYASGLLGPLLVEPEVEFVRGHFERPFAVREGELPGEGGRVTELLCKPLFALLSPELLAFSQPLAGEIAARRELLHRISFATGYAVEAAMQIDVWREVGMDGMAEVDLASKRNDHQSLKALSNMSIEVAEGISRRLRSARDQGAEVGALEPAASVEPRTVDRPPFAEVSSPATLAEAERD